MKIIQSPKQLQAQVKKLRERKKSIGFVPTMGALHAGHLSLVRRAQKENDIVVVSIFVNPTQFGPKEDFRKYPRPAQKDAELLKKEKVDYLFLPSVTAIYPEGFQTFVANNSPHLTKVLCGKSRPGHFEGVLTVVAKLFNIVQPNQAYFGAKDYQQAMVIRQMVKDLNFDLKLKICPIIREEDGLAMSSRNQYLSPKAREKAVEIYKTLKWAKSELKKKGAHPEQVKFAAKQRLRGYVSKIDYFEIVDAGSLVSVTTKQQKMLIACACFVGRTRLIDNVTIRL